MSLESKSKKPTRNNVERGDFFVSNDHRKKGPVLVKIEEVSKGEVRGRYGGVTKSVGYERAIILKKNGEYLIGSSKLLN